MRTPTVFLLALLLGLASCRKKGGGLFTAGIVENLVKNEVEKKMPSATHTKTMTGIFVVRNFSHFLNP